MPGSIVRSESEELMCPGPLWALVSLMSKTCWDQRAEELSFVSLGGQTRDFMCKVDSPLIARGMWVTARTG